MTTPIVEDVRSILLDKPYLKPLYEFGKWTKQHNRITCCALLGISMATGFYTGKTLLEKCVITSLSCLALSIPLAIANLFVGILKNDISNTE